MKIIKGFGVQVWGFVDGLLGLLAVETFRRFGGYGFSYGFGDEEHEAPYRLLMYAQDRDVIRELINDGSGFAIEHLSGEARIKVNPEFVEETGERGYPVALGGRENWYTKVYVWGHNIEDIETAVNRFFRVNPISGELVIEPPRGYEHLDKENFVEDQI